jgi:hypothetical protein
MSAAQQYHVLDTNRRPVTYNGSVMLFGSAREASTWISMRWMFEGSTDEYTVAPAPIEE